MEAIEGLLEPIEGDEPAGPSVRYEPVFDEIKRAREEEDDNIPQGEWKRELKVADFPLVQKLATQVIAEQSKDLQVAAWLTEAWTREKGFKGLTNGFHLLRKLMEKFWDGVHPEIDEDGDLEFRAVPLEWVGRYLQQSIEQVPLTEQGLGFLNHREARSVPSEDEADSDDSKRKARAEAVQAGRTTPEEFQDAVEASSKGFYKGLVADLEASQEALSELEDFCDDRFGDVTPNLIPLRELLSEVHRLASQHLARKLEVDPDPVELEADEPESGGEGTPEGEEAGGGDAGTTVAATGGVPTEIGSVADAGRAAAEAARFLRRKDPTDPSP
jgi:type VI secretion system protein ImpA